MFAEDYESLHKWGSALECKRIQTLITVKGMVSLRKRQTEIMSGLSEVKVKTQIYNRALVASGTTRYLQ